MGKKKIFFITDTLMSFVNQDIEILKGRFDVRVIVVFHEVKNKQNPVSVVSLLYKLLKGIIWSDIIFCWFATDTAYVALRMARIFRKKSVVVIGGYEVANEPGLNYGGLVKPQMASRIQYILNNVTIVVPVSEFTKNEILQISGPSDVQLVYNSIDTEKYTPLGEKENIVITVCYISKRNVAIKGLITFVNTAKLLPNVDFFIIGKDVDESAEQLKDISPPNLSFITNIPEDTLLRWYRKAKVYCQLSYRESFGVALAEAMACGCIPVITDKGAMHEITGDIGYQVPYGDADATAEVIRKALASHDGDRARERIVENFSSEKRERELVDVIEEL
jgi:glycosyltransferase involved in cell wall biosynthesis